MRTSGCRLEKGKRQDRVHLAVIFPDYTGSDFWTKLGKKAGKEMFRKTYWLMISAVTTAALVLAACSGTPQVLGNQADQGGQSSQGNSPAGGTGGNGGFGGGGGITADAPLEAKLAVGLLQLEGTNLSVTPAEAKKMLPLWEQVRSDMASFRTSFN